MKKLILVFICIMSIYTYTQDTLYFDEYNKSISKSVYNDKCKKHLFKCSLYSNDSLTFEKVMFKYKFENLNNTKYQQLRKYIIRETKKSIDTSSVLIINYNNTLTKHSIHLAKKDFKKLTYYHDKGLLKHLFFKTTDNYRLLILKPNGNYFLSGSYISDDQVKTLIEADNWGEFIKDYNQTLEQHVLQGYGFFKKSKVINNNKRCF